MNRKFAYVLICVLLFLLTSRLHGQNNNTGGLRDFDSLPKLEQVKALLKLCWENREKQTDKAIEYGLQGIKIAKAGGFDKELGTLYGYMGVIYQDYKYDVSKALSYYDKGLPISLQVKDSIEIAYIYNNLGDAFYKIGNVPLAFEYGQRSLALFEELHNARGIAYSYVNMGEVNRISEKYDTALNYFRKAISLRSGFNDSIGIASANLEVAQTLFLMGQTDSAMYFFRQSLEKHRQLNNKSYMAYSMQGMGDVFFRENKPDSAYIYFQKSLELCRERHNPTGEINGLLGIAKVLAHRGKREEGEKILDEALANAQDSKLTPNILEVYKAKGEFYLQLGEFRESSENYRNYIRTYDSLFSVLQFQTLSEVKDRFQMTEQLHAVNEDLKDHKREQVYAGLIILLLVIFSVVFFLRNRIIARLSSELLKSNRAKDKIFSIISHDLISPFNALLGTSELLMEDLEEKNLENAKSNGLLIQRISGESYRFILNLLNWARSQQKSINLHKKEFDIGQLMDEVKSMFDNHARLKHISVNINATENLTVKADRSLIQIVLVNLLNNAMKFTRHNGTIDLSLEKVQDQVKVSVKDNGIGISPGRAALLFDSQTIDSLPGTDNEKGTGLGLLLCQEFVGMHGGKIYVASEEGAGSEFWFVLPVS